MTNSVFFNKSKEIADDFIQSIVFLDDRAYQPKTSESPNHDFETLKITQAFARENKICAVYGAESESDISNFKLIADKADVVILDWQIVFPQIIEEGSEEEDEPDDPRGVHTIDILKHISIKKEGLKLIIIYTGETDLNEITDMVYNELNGHIDDLVKDSCQVFSDNIRVLVRSKSSVGDDEVDTKFSHVVDLQDKIVKSKDLPDFVLDEFTKMTSGLLTNFALMSLTTLRKNSSKILSLFSKELDPAYLGHKSIIPKQEDAEDLLIELFGDSVKDLLFYFNVNSILREQLIDIWVDDILNDESYAISNKTFIRTAKLVKTLLNSNEEDIDKRFSILCEHLSKKDRTNIIDKSTILYLNQIAEQGLADAVIKDTNFSKLTHHKSLFIPSEAIPKLTLGTVVKSTLNIDNYYICIQQKCDSVRLRQREERKFLFIPLVVTQNGKFDIITPDGTKLRKIKSSYSIRTIKFRCTNDSGMIVAKSNSDDKFVFNQIYDGDDDEQFEWILDLKDLHAQRIIIEYTSQLSRVGLNESEWHRRYLS